MMNRSIFAILTAGILLAGCSFKPITPRVDTSFKADFNTTNINDAWWMEFRDENLNALVEKTLKNNSDLNLALNNIEYARVSLGLSELEFLPNVSLSGEALRKNNLGNIPDRNSASSYQIGARLSYEIDFWGKIRNRAGAANSSYKAKIYDYNTARLSIASSVTNMYLSLLSLKEQEQILSSTLQSYTETMNYRKRQFEAGVINNIAYFQSQTEVDRAKSALISMQNQLSSTLTALAIMSGESYDEILKGSVKFSDQLPNAPEIPNGIPSDLLLHRADVASALESLKATNFLVGATKAEYFPSFSLTGAFGFASSQFDRLFIMNASSWSAGGSLVAPLLDFGRTKSRVALANLDQNASFINYDKTLKVAFGDVRDALNNGKNAKLKQKSAADLLASSTNLYNSALHRYNEGYSEHIELLDATRGLLSAKLGLAQANLEVLTSVVGIYKALGGGFDLREFNFGGLSPNSDDKESINLINSKETITPQTSTLPIDRRIF